jgi:hydroxyethylthiazole kinase
MGLKIIPAEPDPGNAGEGRRLKSPLTFERIFMMDIFGVLEKVRREKPLVHHITNWVTIYDCANLVKVFGASPVMAHAMEEVEEMASLASSLVLNIGTLTVELVEAMVLAGQAANRKGIPVILDACGAGATRLRNEKTASILDRVKVSVIKGNA